MFEAFLNKDIYKLFDGDTPLDSERTLFMPYLSGVDICKISNKFNYDQEYFQNGKNLSRWMYMEQLFKFACNNNVLDKLISFFFNKKNFTNIYKDLGRSLGSQNHMKIVSLAINKVNDILYTDNISIIYEGETIYIKNNNSKVNVKSQQLYALNNRNIASTYKNLSSDLQVGKFDSAISNSRTLLEEVFCYLLENKNVVNNSKGDLSNLYKLVRDSYELNTNSDLDKSLNKLLSSMNGIVQAIGELRNKAGNSHGLGISKIYVNHSEACFIVNSTISICDYLISLTESDEGKL